MIPGFGATIRRTKGLSALATPTVSSGTSGPRGTDGDPHVLRRWPRLVVARVTGQEDAHATFDADSRQQGLRSTRVSGGVEEVGGAGETRDGFEALDRREDEV